jgi:hypothetical protein
MPLEHFADYLSTIPATAMIAAAIIATTGAALVVGRLAARRVARIDAGGVSNAWLIEQRVDRNSNVFN